MHEVIKVEHHCLDSCPCEACSAERERRGTSDVPTDPSLRKMTVDAAYLLGLMSHRLPDGSLARKLMRRS